MRKGREAMATDLLLLVLPLLSRSSDLVSELIERSVRDKKAPEAKTPQATALEVLESEAILSALMPPLFRRSAQPRLPAPQDGDLMTGVLSQYRKEGDRSRFGLAQAITAVARDIQDPELKWDLEKLGGAETRGTFRRTVEESGVALAPLVERQLLRTA
jgi:hypothetical protein